MAWMENGDVENRSFELQGVSAEGCNMHLVGALEEDDVSQSPRMRKTVANLGLQEVPDIIFFHADCLLAERIFANVWLFKPTYASSCPIEV